MRDQRLNGASVGAFPTLPIDFVVNASTPRQEFYRDPSLALRGSRRRCRAPRGDRRLRLRQRRTGIGVDSAASTQPAEELRLGFFANVDHATPLVGLTEGFYTTSLGDTKLTTQVFNAGPAAIEALLGGSLDASYIGPNPAINAFAKSNGEAIRIVAGTTSGGAALVVKPEINGADDLRGTTLATPQLGNTQDVALRAWLKEEGLEILFDGGGDVTISPTENATTLQLFQDGDPGRVAAGTVGIPSRARGGREGARRRGDLWPEVGSSPRT